MKEPTKKQTLDYIESIPSVSFKNIHGDIFTIHSNGVTVLMSGNEVDMMVTDGNKMFGKYINLFNKSFNIWNKEELYQLGKALMELHK